MEKYSPSWHLERFLNERLEIVSIIYEWENAKERMKLKTKVRSGIRGNGSFDDLELGYNGAECCTTNASSIESWKAESRN